MSKPKACAELRETLVREGDWINNMDNQPPEDTTDYGAQTVQLENSLATMEAAYQNRPKSCQVTQIDYCGYTCVRCEIEVVI
jgi:hypothetical protein